MLTLTVILNRIHDETSDMHVHGQMPLGVLLRVLKSKEALSLVDPELQDYDPVDLEALIEQVEQAIHLRASCVEKYGKLAVDWHDCALMEEPKLCTVNRTCVQPIPGKVYTTKWSAKVMRRCGVICVAHWCTASVAGQAPQHSEGRSNIYLTDPVWFQGASATF